MKRKKNDDYDYYAKWGVYGRWIKEGRGKCQKHKESWSLPRESMAAKTTIILLLTVCERKLIISIM